MNLLLKTVKLNLMNIYSEQEEIQLMIFGENK